MHVLATAGHVDHGKSTLVRALTGMEPDRFAEEHRRGMTIDLGYAWTTLPSGAEVAFVDVPGHQRFIANMLAGLGPAPAVLFVVAADEGWSRQSEEHLAAADALDVRHGLLAVTRSDLAEPAAVTAQARERIARSSLGRVESVAVSGSTGSGLDELRATLDRLVGGLPAPDIEAPIRLWVDRSFTVHGSGTIVTGTLGAGAVTVGDRLALGSRIVTVRALQSLGADHERVPAVARIALNLRGLPHSALSRGDVLLTPDAWYRTDVVDVRVEVAAERLPAELMLHLGTASVPVRLRPLDGSTARLAFDTALPVVAGDRAVLRDPGRQTVAAGVLVLDADPPPLRRRGAAARRAEELATADGPADLHREVSRRGAVRREHLARLGVPLAPVAGVREVGRWLVADSAWTAWTGSAAPALERWVAGHPLEPAAPLAAFGRELDVPDDVTLVAALAEAAGLRVEQGRVTRPGAAVDLGRGAAGVARLAERLRDDPFDAPERRELDDLGLGPRQLTAAQKAGVLLRVSADIVLLPTAPELAAATLRDLPQPFTTSAARQALGSTRRVTIPLLEYLDAQGVTERIDATTRRLR